MRFGGMDTQRVKIAARMLLNTPPFIQAKAQHLKQSDQILLSAWRNIQPNSIEYNLSNHFRMKFKTAYVANLWLVQFQIKSACNASGSNEQSRHKSRCKDVTVLLGPVVNIDIFRPAGFLRTYVQIGIYQYVWACRQSLLLTFAV